MYPYNLHCHTLLSDGCLVASEVAVRYAAAGYKAIAITDHADYSNIKMVLPAVCEFVKQWRKYAHVISVLPGVELTHVPPLQFKPLAAWARKNGAQVIIGHGQTPVEPVFAGTNRAALMADIDILAHPGHITEEDALLATQRGIFLEITSRRGHGNTNAHVASIAQRVGAKVCINTDGHAPEDIISPRELEQVGRKAGLRTDTLKLSRQHVLEFIQGRCAQR